MMDADDESLAENERQDSDYDGAWKETLRSHLIDSMRLCFPKFASLVDWSIEPELLDKEISQIVGLSGHRNRKVDLLFKVRLMDGRDQWILCHLEVQTARESDFEFRQELYNAGLKWMFRREVVTLVILADLNRDWRPNSYHFELGDYQADRRFPICKLLDRLSTDWIDEISVVAQVARAQIAALKTASDPQSRFTEKTQLVRNLYRVGYNADKVREIFRLIDWMMRLRFDLDRRFKAELAAFEEELSMPYVTSIERLAKEEGLEEGQKRGEKQGSAALLLKILKRQCDGLPETLQRKIHELTIEKIELLAESLPDIHSAEDLDHWFSRQE